MPAPLMFALLADADSGEAIPLCADSLGRLLVSSAPVASDGVLLPLDSLQQVLTYDGNGRLSTITVTQGADSYRQTLTYDGAGKLTGVSAWEAQP